jgi:hypothetical protein
MLGEATWMKSDDTYSIVASWKRVHYWMIMTKCYCIYCCETRAVRIREAIEGSIYTS